MAKKDKTEAIVSDSKFRGEVSQLMLDHVTGPDDMTKLPGILLALMQTVVGSLQTSGMSKEDVLTFVDGVAGAAYDHEKDNIDRIRKIIESGTKYTH